MNTRTLLSIISITAGLALPVHAQSVPTNGLIAYFPFEGNALDASGNGNNGTLFGAATFGTDRFGNADSCLALPGGFGVGSGVDVPSLDSMAYEPVTYSAWFWLSNYPPPLNSQQPNSWMPILGRMQCGAQYAGTICVYSSDNHQTNFIGYFTGATGYVSQLTPPTNQWCQVVMTITSSGTPTFYFNGTNLPASGTAPAGQTLDFRIGAASPGSCTNGPSYVWNGLIDDVRIYNRVLSASEVEQLYQAEEGCPNYYATAVAIVTNGFLVGANVTAGGCGFTNPPLVFIEGGGGTGATAVAVLSNGVVASITITDAGIGYTNTPSIYIYTPLAITAQPQSVLTNIYDNATFSVTAQGNPPLSYQWSFDGTNIAGATSSALTISNIVGTNLGVYAVAVSNPFGTTNSAPATLSMYPYITDPFGGLDTYWGYTNTLSVEADGSGPLDYQWFENGNAIAGATNDTLTLTGVQAANAGLYTVVVSNAFGSATNPPAQVVVQPAGVSVALYPGVTIQGVVGYSYTIQSTANLGATNSWVTLTNLTLTEPVQLWLDTNTDASIPANAQRFYQVLPGQ